MNHEFEDNGWRISPDDKACIDTSVSRTNNTNIPPQIVQALKAQVKDVPKGEGEWIEKDGYLHRENELFVPEKLFFCIYTPADEKFHKKAEINRTYNRYTSITVPSILSKWDKPLDVYRQGQSTSEYIKTYDEVFGDETIVEKPEHQWGSALTIEEGGIDFEIIHSDVVKGGRGNPIIHSQMRREGEILTTEFAIRDLSVDFLYTNYGKSFGRLGRVTILRSQTPEAWAPNDIDGSLRQPLEISFPQKDIVSVSTYKKDAFGYAQDYDHPSIVTDQKGFYRAGRLMTVINSADAIKIVVAQQGRFDPSEEDRDFTVTIPKFHKVSKIIDHNGNDVNRYEAEEKLIVDALRRLPFQLPHKADDMWRFADLREVMNVRVEKNNRPKRIHPKEDFEK